MASGPGAFIRKNIKDNSSGALGKGFVAFDVANLVTSKDKLKSIWQLMKDMILLRPIMAAGFASLFLGMSKAIRSLVHDTGSLEAALKKLSQIQNLQKMFTGIVGGAQAAKIKVAELVNFAATRNIKLGDAAEASRSLSLMTKNAFATSEALDTVNDAANATNNGIVDLADAIGDFHSVVNGGGSIDAATEKLRQMGVINDATAQSFVRLKENGATNGQIFGALTAALEQFKGAADQARESIDGVNEASDKAATNLQEKFGSPFVEDDVKNTKNYTEAMTALAPSVARVGKFFNALTGGFSTVKSEITKSIAQNVFFRESLEGLVYILGSLVTIAGVLGASSLAKFFAELSVSLAEVNAKAILSSTSMNMLGKALSFLGVSGSATEAILGKLSRGIANIIKIGPMLLRAIPVVAVGVAIGSAVKKWIESFDEAAKAIQELQQGQNQANQVIANQIKAVRTLTDMHEAVTAALKRETEAREELTAAEAAGNKEAIKAAETSLKRAEVNRQKATNINKDNLGPTAEETEALKRDIARGRSERDARFQARLSLAPASQRAAMMKQNLGEMDSKIARGEHSEEATATYSRRRAEADINVATAEGTLTDERAELKRLQAQADAIKPQKVRGTGAYADVWVNQNQKEIDAAAKAVSDQQAYIDHREMDLNEKKKQQSLVGSDAKFGTTTEIRSRMLQNELSTDPNKEKNAVLLRRELELAIIDEKEAGANRLERIQKRATLMALEREQRLNKMAEEREMDIQKADVNKDYESKQRLEDLSTFADKYQQLKDKGYSDEEAKKMATEYTDNAVSLRGGDDQLKLASAAVADSLTRIGGGGGVYTPGGDDMKSIAQRTNELHLAELEYLKQIAEADKAAEGVL